jgi:hypothetical protein
MERWSDAFRNQYSNTPVFQHSNYHGLRSTVGKLL